uniref:Wsv011-like protein n=1 Tax=Trachysalambria curvirostris nimavirus TaxID=2984282 RepID=A0A9C7BNG2_9VIRU|nr:MAG: wsv011-like protein [Trachysalambria curvirostris nimavirus]
MMTPITLSVTTRRVASGKGNYSKADAILGKQYPNREKSTASSSPPNDIDIALLQSHVENTIDSWYASGGEQLPDLTKGDGGWGDMINLAERLYDPVLCTYHSPSTLSHRASLAAAAFASLATVIEEKISIFCGDEGVLARAATAARSVPATDILISNESLNSILYNRLILMEKLQKNPAAIKTEIVMRRMAQLREAPLPHRLTLFERFGGGAKEEGLSCMSAAGTTNASDTHCTLVNHLFKVAFRKSGPNASSIGPSLGSLPETHALTRYIIRGMYGEDVSTHRPEYVSIFYCDCYDYIAYNKLPEQFRRSSIIPGSYRMEDLPFRPFAVPYHYKIGGHGKKYLFNYTGVVQSTSNPDIGFDYGEYLCYYIFGMGWDKHLGDIVDSLECSSMSCFEPNNYSGVFKDTHNFNRLSGTRLGVPDLALRSAARFIRDEALAAAVGESRVLIYNDGPLNRLQKCIRDSVHELRAFIEDVLPDIVSRFKRDLGEEVGDYGEAGEFECLTAHLFLTRMADECHILRNTDIQRTVFSTSISLLRRNIQKVSEGTRVQTYADITDIPRSVLEGLSGDSSKDSYIFGDRAVVSWDGSAGRVIGLWRSSGTDFLRVHTNFAKKYKKDIWLVDTIKSALREASENGGLNPVFYSRDAIYRSLAARGIFSPGGNLTVDSRNRSLSNMLADPSMEVPMEGRVANLNIGSSRGLFSGFRDILEMKALRVYARDAFGDVGASIRAETEALGAYNNVETSFIDNIASGFTADASLGLEMSEETGSIVIKDSQKSLLSESRALRSNEVSLSSVMKDMGIQVSQDLDAEFAAEMRESYPDTAIKEMDMAARDIEESMPVSQSKKLDAIGKDAATDLEEVEQQINDTELSKAADSVLGKRLGNGVTVFMGRFATTALIVGYVPLAGFLGSAALGMVHASRGAHLNVVDHSNPNGVTAYKLTEFSCADKTLGWAKRAIHPFREEIDDAINSDQDFSRASGAHVVDDQGHSSRNRAWAPICGEKDAKVSECGSWATYDEPGSVLPWIAPMTTLPRGQSLSCNKGMTALQAVSATLLSLGKDIASEVFEVVEDTVLGATERAFSTAINSPALLIGVPIALGIAATRLQISNWRVGLLVATTVLVLMLVVRFFAGSGFLTLNWFGAKDSVKRENTEAYEIGDVAVPVVSQKYTSGRVRMRRGDPRLRPVFFPATTNYSRSAKIIGYNTPSFASCYADVRKQMSRLIDSRLPVSGKAWSEVSTSHSDIFNWGPEGEATFTPRPLIPQFVASNLPSENKDASLVVTADPGNYLGPRRVANTAIGKIYVICGDTSMPAKSLHLKATLPPSVFISFSGPNNLIHIMNTDLAKHLHVFISKDEYEYHPISLPGMLVVPPASSVSTSVSVTGHARKLFISCRWGQSLQEDEVPASLCLEVSEMKAAHPHRLKPLSVDIKKILGYTALKSGISLSQDIDETVSLLDLLSATVGYLHARGYPTHYLVNTNFIRQRLSLLLKQPLDNTFIRGSENEGGPVASPIEGEEDTDRLRLQLGRIKSFGNISQNMILDQIVALGLYFYSPLMESIMFPVQG